MKNKIELISSCLDEREVDLWQLREYAISEGGFVNSSLRRRAWSKLVGVNNMTSSSKKPIDVKKLCQSFSEDVCSKRGEEIKLIDRDLNRSVLIRHLQPSPSFDHASKSQSPTSKFDQPQAPPCNRIGKHQMYLGYVLKSVTAQSDANSPNRFHYYQGYHDVAAMFLLNVVNPQLASNILGKVSKSHFRDAMRKDFSCIHGMLKTVLFPLIDELDEDIHESLMISEIDESVVLPWIISWFSHDLQDANLSSRLFDFFIASHPLMPVYFAIAIIVNSQLKKQILNSDDDTASMYVTISSLLSKISNENGANPEDPCPSLTSTGSFSSVATEETREEQVANESYKIVDRIGGTINVQTLIDEAIEIMRKYPPGSLVSLSKRYYREMNGEQPTLKQITSIQMLKAAPQWSLVSKIPADWVVRQRKRGKLKKLNSFKKVISPKKTSSTQMSSSKMSNSRVACGLSPIEDFCKTGKRSNTMSTILLDKVKNSHTSIVDAYSHFTRILIRGRRKRITR